MARWLVDRRLDVESFVGIGIAPLCVIHHAVGGGIEGTSLEDFICQTAAGLPVLVAQQ